MAVAVRPLLLSPSENSVKLSLPLLVRASRPPDQSGTVYVVRPLFFPWPEEHDGRLSRAMAKVVMALRKELEDLGVAGRHRALSDWCFHPDVELEQCELRLDLQEQMFRGYFPVVSFKRLDRRVAFCPQVPDVWFEVHRGETVRDRAAAVYQQHFRRLRRQEENVAAILGPLARKQQVWITPVELEVDARQEFKKSESNFFALLGGSQTVHGGHELQRVGRCLDWRYPDGLHRALHREDLTTRLETLLGAADNRPVLLVGPRQSGKTALVHEFVFRKVARQKSAYQATRNVWLVSPQRLISGMSYVGQWENRLLAILRHVRRKKHTLYFDDLVGLHRAGVSSSSSLSVADVLKPYIERREVRVLGEMTPEQLRVFRERDRGLADLFQVVPVEETDEPTTLRILLASLRLLESRHQRRFDLDVLPTALDLTRRYVRDAALPGKAAAFLARLAAKHQTPEVRRGDVLAEFHAASGLDLTLLDSHTRLQRREVVQALSQDIIGQPQALDALADVVCIAKARLNDPSRPLGSLLFLGPTGVGKTQSAKALAKYLFGDAARLVRFDMNEFVTAESAARLAGVFDRPEGLLTSEVRRQPFSVVLLDEIEKAHPDVFDLLLQVLGEGRLTDGLGRTADFTNTVILLTSNLGTRQAAERMGFERGAASEAEVYVKAVEDFFRPEFFNRLDRIVPFNRLGRSELAQIAEMTLHEVLSREGLVRRRCALQVAPEAMDWVIERGYHPVLGARAMKRAVEQELVQPLARRLTNIAPSTPVVLRITRPGDKIELEAVALANAACPPEARRPARIDDPAAWLERIHRALDRVGEQCRSHRPSLEFSAGAISAEQYHYLACEEFLKAAREEHWRLRGALEAQRRPHGATSLPSHAPPRRYRRTKLTGWLHNEPIDQVFSEQDLDDYLTELAEQSRTTLGESEIEQDLRALIDHAALLDALAPNDDGWRQERVLLLVQGIGNVDREWIENLTRHLERLLSRWPVNGRVSDADTNEEYFGLETQRLHHAAEPAGLGEAGPVLLVEGCNAAALAGVVEGSYLRTDREGRMGLAQVAAWPVAEQEDPRAARERWFAAYANGRRENQDGGPAGYPPIVRIESGLSNVQLDLRTGYTSAASDAFPLRDFLAALPLPVELRETTQDSGKPEANGGAM